MKGGIKSAFVDAMLGPRVQSASRTFHKLGRALRRAPRAIRYYHRVDDPRSWLYATFLERFVDAYGLGVEVEVVPEPAAEVDPEPELRARFDVEDTRRLARAFGVPFPEPGSEPVPARIRLANSLALAPRPGRSKLEHVARISTLLLARNGDALARMADETGTTKGTDLRPSLEASYARLRKHGHYAGAVVEYEGELYAGVERLRHLELRLVAEGLEDKHVAPVLAMPAESASGEPVEVEIFFSYRSPYSYVGLERLVAIADAYGLTIRMRPVLPMVMRGLAVPADKRLYIVRDAKREADLHGIPFGRLVDPVGTGAERCLAVHVHAERVGKAVAFAREAARGIWSRGLDMASDEGLLDVASKAGLDEAFVRAALADESFRVVVEQNRELLYELGIWGVPAFRVGDFVTWGQDRLPLVVEKALATRRRAA